MPHISRKHSVANPVSFIAGLVFVLVSASLTPASAQVISPVQSGHYAPAVINIRDMGYPPSGLFVITYNLFISSDTYIDREGNELKTLSLGQLDPTLPSVDLQIDLNAFSTVPALFWGSSFTLLGGARYLVGVSPSYVTASGTVVSEARGGATDTTIRSVDEATVAGWGDLFVAPLGLSWGFDQFDATFFYGFYAPTGRYATGDDDNMGLGFWTHQVQGYGYYYPIPDHSTAIMLGLTYELNGTVKDADVTPGNRFSLEWGISQYLSEQLEVGVQGGHNWQVSDDTGDDVYWDPSFYDRKSTIAFSLGYWPWKNRLYIAGRYSFDLGIRARFKSNYWSVNLLFLTNALTGEG
ncbi:MAG: transporter [Bacteroidota bacterium]